MSDVSNMFGDAHTLHQSSVQLPGTPNICKHVLAPCTAPAGIQFGTFAMRRAPFLTGIYMYSHNTSLYSKTRLGDDLLKCAKHADITMPTELAFDVKYLCIAPKVALLLHDMASCSRDLVLVKENEMLDWRAIELRGLTGTIAVLKALLATEFSISDEAMAAFVSAFSSRVLASLKSIHGQSLENVKAAQAAFVKATQAKHVAETLGMVRDEAALDGPMLFERSKAAAAQAVNKCWREFCGSADEQRRVHASCVDLKAVAADLSIDLTSIEASQSALAQQLESEAFASAKQALATMIALQALFRPTTAEQPRSDLVALGLKKIQEVGVHLPPKLETMMGQAT